MTIDRKRLRSWLAIAGGVAVLGNGAVTAYNASVTARVLEEREKNLRAAEVENIRLEVVALEAWRDKHTLETAPLLDALKPMEAEWPQLRGMVEDIHLFLVRRFQMPTTYPYELGPDDEPSSGLIAGEMPAPAPRKREAPR